MPVKYGKEKGKCYMRWGNVGPKRYYTCGDEESRKRAKAKVDADRKRIEYYKHQNG